MELIYTAIGLFSLAALIGLYMLSLVLQKRQVPRVAAITHGLFAATALILLIVDMVKSGADTVQIVVLFIITALGGIVLFARDITGRSLPKSLAIFHGLLAVSGFIFLLIYTFGR
ncbi:MAG: hypothetical protein K0S23_1562 [Fluviicola sp.]|jgi:hypothetical protein|uniref:hypothetical protein n=1 Tax=Fluviicola sp. TaxID=1917219 RepID=UPI0026393CDA|nr:hypothetical protein [Fluviicola sp.]MDF3027255.1 hypothetical protein [Fluviicola sp.]